MSITRCKYCEWEHDTDYHAEHEEQCKEEYMGNSPNVINVGDEDSPKWLEVPEHDCHSSPMDGCHICSKFGKEI
jgi:hypothetical protein